MNIKDLIVSFVDLTRHVIFAQRGKVLFYYPQHFNRSADGTNPFFDSMLESCERNGIAYKQIEEPDYGTDKPRNPKAIRGDFFLLTVWAVRKVVKTLFPSQDMVDNEVKVAKIVDVLFLGRLRYKKYITISGSMFHLFPHIMDGSDVYDMQHGILYKHHYTFFDEKTLRLRPKFYAPHLHWLFWGEGYKDCFEKGEERYLTNKCHVIGYPIPTRVIQRQVHDKTLLVSLQLTNDASHERLLTLKNMLVETIEGLSECGVRILLKDHPRFNNCISLEDIYEQFANVEHTDCSLDELYGRVYLHVTYFSTTTFEFANYGVPTAFMHDEMSGETLHRFFYEVYGYPLYEGMSVADVVKRLEDSENNASDSIAVKRWYDRFYSPFDEKEFIRIINE